MYAQSIQFYKLNDEDLMERLQGGYDNAFRILVDRYQDKIHNFIFRYTRNVLDSEDLVQETFLRVYRCRHSYARIAKFSTWLYTIALNLVKTHYKKNTRMQLVSIDGTDRDEEIGRPMEIADYQYAPDDYVQNRMITDSIEKALERLPEEFKDVVIMRDLQNLTYEEIMAITGLPMGTVKSRINRGRLKIQELLRNYNFSGN